VIKWFVRSPTASLLVVAYHPGANLKVDFFLIIVERNFEVHGLNQSKSYKFFIILWIWIPVCNPSWSDGDKIKTQFPFFSKLLKHRWGMEIWGQQDYPCEIGSGLNVPDFSWVILKEQRIHQRFFLLSFEPLRIKISRGKSKGYTRLFRPN
jgi:hypothetical protein